MAAPINRLESLWPQSEAAESAARRGAASWGSKARSWEGDLEALLRKYPKVAIAAAAAVGVALGWIVKRK